MREFWALWLSPEGWSAAPAVLVVCGAAALLYGRGRRAAGPRPVWRAMAFGAGLLALLLATCSPLDVAADELFSVHMTQHLLLMVVVPPLLVLGDPWRALRLGIPVAVRAAAARAPVTVHTIVAVTARGLLRPGVTLGLVIAVMWGWHWPVAFDLALRNDAVHEYGEHASFLLVSLLLWSQLLGTRLSDIGRVGLDLAVMAQNIALSAVLAYSGLLYSPYEARTVAFGVDPLTDQQIGAALMWVLGDLPLAIVLAAGFHRWLGRQMADDAAYDNGRDGRHHAA